MSCEDDASPCLLLGEAPADPRDLEFSKKMDRWVDSERLGTRTRIGPPAVCTAGGNEFVHQVSHSFPTSCDAKAAA